MTAPANTLEVIRSAARAAWEEATDRRDYSFDAAGRMASGTQSIGGTQSTSNTYVGDQWYRVQSTTNGTTLKYGWKRDALFAELNSSNDLVAGYLNDGVDQPLYKTRFSGNGSVVDGRDFYHKDANWRVHHVTDGSGAISEKYVYNAYGKRTILDSGNGVLGASAIGNRIGFQGREHEDVESEAQEDGLTYHRNRFLDSDMGRWERRDPIGYRGGLNLFAFASGSFVSHADSYGFGDKPTQTVAPIPAPDPIPPNPLPSVDDFNLADFQKLTVFFDDERYSIRQSAFEFIVSSTRYWRREVFEKILNKPTGYDQLQSPEYNSRIKALANGFLHEFLTVRFGVVAGNEASLQSVLDEISSQSKTALNDVASRGFSFPPGMWRQIMIDKQVPVGPFTLEFLLRQNIQRFRVDQGLSKKLLEVMQAAKREGWPKVRIEGEVNLTEALSIRDVPEKGDALSIFDDDAYRGGWVGSIWGRVRLRCANQDEPENTEIKVNATGGFEWLRTKEATPSTSGTPDKL